MLVGRESERRVVEELIAGARLGASGVLVVAGEPGIGKSALVEESAALATGMQVLRARGAEAEREVPFGGLAQLLRPALAQLEAIPAPQRDALASALALRPGPPGDRFAVGAATLSLLCRHAESAPVALLVDDVHLLDRPSAEALLFTARRLLADPIVLVAAARVDEPHPLAGADLPELRLHGVDLAAAQQLVAARAGRTAPVDVVARLHRAVGGNPLALLELAGDPQQLEVIPPGAPVPVPAVLAHAFAARADRLGPAARTALLVAAAEGSDLDVIAAACTVLGVDAGSLAEAEERALVDVSGNQVVFRHPLVRSAVYASADPQQRRAAHAAVAAVLPGGDDRRAWHLSESVLGADAEVADGLAAAARRASARGAHAVAATGHERAARFTGGPVQRATRLVDAGAAAWSAGLPDRADRLLAEALAGGPPLPVRTRAQELRGDVAVKCGSPERARDILVCAAADAAATRPEHAVCLLVDAVLACFRLGDARSALQSGRRIEELLAGITDRGVRTLGSMALGMALVLAGRGGTDLIRDAVGALAADPAEPGDDRRRVVLSVLGPLFLRESAAGRTLLHDTVQRSRDRAALAVLPTLLFHVARDEATTDRWARAETTYDEAVRLARETGQTTELGVSLAGLAWLHAHQGREGDCRARAAEAIALCAERRIHLGVVWSRFALGDLELGRGEPAEALGHYARLVDELGAVGIVDADLSPAPELVDVYARIGRTADAARAAGEFAEVAAAKGQPWALARAARACGIVAPDDELDTCFTAALTEHSRTVDAFEQARTRLAYGARLRRARRRVDARRELRLAVAAFDDLGATGWADQAAAELRATGETARRREPSSADDLTPQERQIALLLAAGRSTREAAAAMFLSPKTVEYHLRNVYAKLAIHSRAELADAIRG